MFDSPFADGIPAIKQGKPMGAYLSAFSPVILSAVLPGLFFSSVIQAQMTLEEVTVTAQKREASLQDTPIAVSAYTSEAMASKGIDNISELANFTPNLTFDTTSPIGGLSSGAAVFIRGIGNSDFSLTTDPGVGTYVDGVYMSRSVGGVLDVLDVERIEVLRGPQGTLFGRNTIGGALNITSRRPADELSGALELSLGNFNRKDLRASIDVPIGESFYSNVSLSSKTHDGYVDRVLGGGDKLGDEERLSTRILALWELSEQWDLQFSADYSDINEASAPSAGGGFTIAFPDGTPGGAGVLGYALAEFGDINKGLENLQQYIVSAGDDKTFGTGLSGSKIQISGVSLAATYHADRFDLKYTTSARETDAEFYSDPDNTPFSITEVYNPDYHHEQVSHELQINGDLFEQKLTYVGGIFYFEEEGVDNVFVPLHLPAPDLSLGFRAGLSNFAEVNNSSAAVFLQLDYQLSDMFGLTAGVRRTKDKKYYKYTQYIGADIQGNPLPFFPGAVDEFGVFRAGLNPLVGNGSGQISDEFKQTTFKFGLNATLESGSLLYYSFSQGFKSGGFVLRYVEAQDAPLGFEPETLDSHEFGIKWQGWEDKLRINSAFFYSDYEEIQVTFFDRLGGPVTANAGTAEIKGFELELTAVLGENVLLDLGYGYTDAKYKSLNKLEGLSSAINKSDKLVNTPENSFNLGLELSVDLFESPLDFRIDYSYTDDIQNDSQNSPFLTQKAIGLWNLSARYQPSETMEWRLFAENISDKRYIVSGNSNFGLGFHSVVYSQPRMFGASLKYKF